MPFSELLYLFIGLLTLLIAIMFSVRISYDNREPIGNAFGVHIVWGMVYLAAIAFIIALVGPNWIYPADFALAVLVLPSIIATYFMSKFVMERSQRRSVIFLIVAVLLWVGGFVAMSFAYSAEKSRIAYLDTPVSVPQLRKALSHYPGVDKEQSVLAQVSTENVRHCLSRHMRGYHVIVRKDLENCENDYPPMKLAEINDYLGQLKVLTQAK